MNRTLTFPLVALLLLGVLTASPVDSGGRKADSAAIAGQRQKLRRGEKLLYSIQWRGAGITFVTAGTSYLKVDSELTYARGRQAYHLVNETWSTPTFSFFYRVHDRSESFVDYETLSSLAFNKKIQEGGYRHEEGVEFDHQQGKAYYSTGQAVDLVPGSKDILLTLFLTRMLPIREGGEVTIDNHTDKQNYPLVVKVLRKETIKTALGKVECLVVEPGMRTPGLFENKGKLWVWLTNDERRIPVLMRSKIVIGSINAVLKEYTPGDYD